MSLELFRALTGARPHERSAEETQALERLIDIAKRDTGQSRYVADFLLAWWNASNCGGFDLTSLWGVDTVIAADMVTVFGLIAKVYRYPDTLGYEADFKAIARAWRPELKD
jgi:hypothetical protein